ncbi:MAG TPA: FecR domain-containing protein [Pyrinomonadaceae bacterium]|nr:FecR domain-containing protein [Pyrinomonadaceae bacterium]
MVEAEVVGRRHLKRVRDAVNFGAHVIGLFALTLLTAVGSARQAQVISARAGLVTRVEGEVRCHHHEREAGVEELHVGERLHDEDIVFINGSSRAQRTLNPGSYLSASPDTTIRVYDTSLNRMSFGIERGEVVIIARSLGKDVSLTIRTPPGQLTVYKSGLYRFRVTDDGGTEAEVVKGELRYVDERENLNVVKKGRSVTFRKSQKLMDHAQ